MSTRNTRTKEMILELLEQAEQALSHDQMREQLKDEQIDRATIYRILNRYVDEGLVHRVVVDDGKQYFRICGNKCKHKHHHNHFHFRCMKCNKVECLNKEVKVDLPTGYQFSHFNGVISGYCAACG